MNREEKVKIIKTLENFLVDDENLDELFYNKGYNTERLQLAFDFIFDMLATVKNILSIPPRTIETLEIGDYVEFELDGVGKIYNAVNTYDLLNAKQMLSNGMNISNIKIIPHQLITELSKLWTKQQLNITKR